MRKLLLLLGVFTILTSSLFAGGQSKICEDFAGGNCQAVDRVNEASVVQSDLHYLIHNGKLEVCSLIDEEVNLIEDKNIQIETGSNTVHVRFIVYSDKAVDIYLMTGVNVVATGVTMVAANYNQNFAVVQEVICYDDPTVDNTGNTIFSKSLGAGETDKVGGATDGLNIEWVFVPNTTYILRVVVENDATELGFEIDFYEDDGT